MKNKNDTPVQVPDQEDRTHEAQQEHEDVCVNCDLLNNKYVHLLADFQNYKRRVEKDRAIWVGDAQEALLLRLLPIVDDFDRALQQHHAHEQSTELDAWLKGFELIGKSLYKLFDQYGVVRMQDYSAFDPVLHEAVAQVESDKHESGAIVDVYESGFMIGDKVLRVAKVSVAK